MTEIMPVPRNSNITVLRPPSIMRMLFLFLLSFAAAVFFGVRWFKVHSFEYLNGMKPSEQLDASFWLCIGFVALALILGAAAFL